MFSVEQCTTPSVRTEHVADLQGRLAGPGLARKDLAHEPIRMPRGYRRRIFSIVSTEGRKSTRVGFQGAVMGDLVAWVIFEGPRRDLPGAGCCISSEGWRQAITGPPAFTARMASRDGFQKLLELGPDCGLESTVAICPPEPERLVEEGFKSLSLTWYNIRGNCRKNYGGNPT